jgi:PPR repeat
MRSAFICQERRGRLYSTLPISASLFCSPSKTRPSQLSSLPLKGLSATPRSPPPFPPAKYGGESTLSSLPPFRRRRALAPRSPSFRHLDLAATENTATKNTALTSSLLPRPTVTFSGLDRLKDSLAGTQERSPPDRLDGDRRATPGSWSDLAYAADTSVGPVATAKASPEGSGAEASHHLTTLWFLLKKLLGPRQSDGGPSTLHLVEQEELCRVWRRIFLAFGSESDRVVDSSNVLKYDWNIWKHAPVRSFFVSAGSGGTADATRGTYRVSRVLPLVPEKYQEHYFAAMVATFSYMVMRPSCCAQGAYSPFLRSLATILRRSDHLQYTAAINDQLDLDAQARSQLNSILKDLELHTTIVLACHESLGSHDARRYALASWHIRLFRHLSKRGDTELFDSWLVHSLRHFRALDSHWNSDRSTTYDSHEQPFPRTLCRELIRLASLSKKPNLSVEIWALLIDYGFKPEMADWASLIDGAKHTGRVEAIADIWALLCGSGVEPGVEAWTARINAVLQIGHTDLGMKLLKEMTTQWIDASKTLHPGEKIKDMADLPNAPKPSIWTINAVLKTLIGRRDKRFVHDVLNMAWSLGLKPDIYTLNIVLSMYCQTGNISSALDTIRRFTLADPSLELNRVTFTTLINGVFHFPKATPYMMDDFANRVDYAMALIGRQRLSLDDVFFSTLLRAVASKTDFKVAVAVLEHAHRHLGLSACVHTSTEFLKHAFREARSRPHHEREIVQLVLKLAVHIDRYGDSTFWNKLVIGFAKLGRLEYVTRFLAKLKSNGQVPGWLALFAALKVALDRRDMSALEFVLTESQRAADARGGTGTLPRRETVAREEFVRLFQEIDEFLTKGSIEGGHILEQKQLDFRREHALHGFRTHSSM